MVTSARRLSSRLTTFNYSRRVSRNEEHQMQKALFLYRAFKTNLHTITLEGPKNLAWSLLEGSMNGVQLSKAQAGKAKACGMLKGAPDVRLPVPSIRYYVGVVAIEFHGLAIELKCGKNTPTQEQKGIMGLLEAAKWCCWVVWDDWQVAAKLIESYIDGTVETFSHPLARRFNQGGIFSPPARDRSVRNEGERHEGAQDPPAPGRPTFLRC